MNTETNSDLSAEHKPDGLFRILALDGGGAKGFYSLGVLREVEALIKSPLYKRFDLVYGTSTGAIIASLIALGYAVDDIHTLYKEHVPKVMKASGKEAKSEALARLAEDVFKEQTFKDVKTRLGVVTAKWMVERPMIFKGDPAQAFGGKATFAPGFGVNMSDAVQASCSAYPFFTRKTVVTSDGDHIELVDGGYCANNPSLYAISDAVGSLGKSRPDIRLVNIGVGQYPPPKPTVKMWVAKRYIVSVELLQKTLEINTQSMDQLRRVLFGDIQTVRISDSFEQPEMATDFLEHDLTKLNMLRQRGKQSFAAREQTLRDFLL